MDNTIGRALFFCLKSPKSGHVFCFQIVFADFRDITPQTLDKIGRYAILKNIEGDYLLYLDGGLKNV